MGPRARACSEFADRPTEILRRPTPSRVTVALDGGDRAEQLRRMAVLVEDRTERDPIACLGPGLVGHLQLGRKLGEGGMGVVYQAHHRRLGTRVAMKLLRPEVAGRAAYSRRFLVEARALSRLRHPGIVQCFDFGIGEGDVPYIVMEYLEGETLEERLRGDARIDLAIALEIGGQVARALAAAHRAGVIHRDVKPSNIFLLGERDSVRVKVMDFGLAKLLEPETSSTPDLSTATGGLLGTPAYMSPEQCRGDGRIDARSDVYSLGCVLYAMLCGRPPFAGRGMGDYVTAHLTCPPPPPRALEPSITPGLEHVIMTALAKDPDERQSSMEELTRALAELASDPTRTLAARPTLRPRHRRIWIAAGAALAGLIALAVPASSQSPRRHRAATQPIEAAAMPATPTATPPRSIEPARPVAPAPAAAPPEVSTRPPPPPASPARRIRKRAPVKSEPAPAPPPPARLRARGGVLEPRF